MPRPPCPTLFPYTTLFRSLRVGGGCAKRQDQGQQGNAGFHIVSASDSQSSLLQLLALPKNAAARGIRGATSNHPAAAIRDRKSTRLNSSHSQISYAVFCLK